MGELCGTQLVYNSGAGNSDAHYRHADFRATLVDVDTKVPGVLPLPVQMALDKFQSGWL
jgi:hypothetical protein